jgi:hypothetical protein
MVARVEAAAAGMRPGGIGVWKALRRGRGDAGEAALIIVTRD